MVAPRAHSRTVLDERPDDTAKAEHNGPEDPELSSLFGRLILHSAPTSYNIVPIFFRPRQVSPDQDAHKLCVCCHEPAPA
jgi:hypothetical protein